MKGIARLPVSGPSSYHFLWQEDVGLLCPLLSSRVLIMTKGEVACEGIANEHARNIAGQPQLCPPKLDRLKTSTRCGEKLVVQISYTKKIKYDIIEKMHGPISCWKQPSFRSKLFLKVLLCSISIGETPSLFK